MIKKLQTYLQTYHDGGFIFKRPHPDLPITIWNYTQKVQYEGLWDWITVQTRGLVTDEHGEILARPFKKFWNLGEQRHTATDQFEVFEKLDGSLIIAFWYEDRWIIASRGSFESDHAKAAKPLFDKLHTDVLSKAYTYCFEYISTWNKIVVDYGDVEKLVLLSAIHTKTDTELKHRTLEKIGKLIGCEVVERYDGIDDYTTLKDKIDSGKEGFVIRFSNGQRVKIKSDEYVKLHRIVTGLSSTAVWECLQSKRTMDDLLATAPDEYFEIIKLWHDKLLRDYKHIEDTAIQLYERYIAENPDATQKEYALWVNTQDAITRPVLFRLKQNRTDYEDYIWKLLKPKYEKL